MYAMRDGETDLAFAELGGPGRAYTAPAFDRNFARPRNPFFQLVGRLRLEPRTNGLKARCSTIELTDRRGRLAEGR